MSSVRIWERTYELRRRLLWGFFLRHGTHREDAEDLAQEVYLRLLRATGEDAVAVENPEAYLYTVAGNLARERARVRSSQPALEDIDLLVEVLRSEDDIEGEYERQQRWKCIRDTLARLSPTTRIVMDLHYREGLDCTQIGVQLDISVHMVRKHVGKGLHACRQVLCPEELA